MAGLMIAGRLKTVREKSYLLNQKKYQNFKIAYFTKEENQRLTSLENDSQLNDNLENKNLNINENSFEKILSSINGRLSSLLQYKSEKK